MPIDDSKPAVRFNLEVAPNDFVRGMRGVLVSKESPRHILRRQFWADLIEYLAEHSLPSAKGGQTTIESWNRILTGRVVVYYPYEKGKAEQDKNYRNTLFDWADKSIGKLQCVAKKYLVDR